MISLDFFCTEYVPIDFRVHFDVPFLTLPMLTSEYTLWVFRAFFKLSVLLFHMKRVQPGYTVELPVV